MNLLTNFNEFAEEIQWICWPNSLNLHSHQRHSASSRTSFNVIENVIQHGCKRHVVEQNKLICRGKQIDLPRKTNWFAEENKLICRGNQIDLLRKTNWFAEESMLQSVETYIISVCYAYCVAVATKVFCPTVVYCHLPKNGTSSCQYKWV